MAQLRSIKSKLSWQVLILVGFYVVSLLVFMTVFLPASNRVRNLQNQLDHLNEMEQTLVGTLGQKPRLEGRLKEAEANVSLLARQIPSQYDLPAVLDVVRELSEHHKLSIVSLEHIPVQTSPGSDTGVIPLVLEVYGGHKVFSYLLHMQEVLPSLRVTQVSLGYAGENQFHLEMRADLQVLLLEHAPHSALALPQPTQIEPMELATTAFGLPFEIVGQFLNKQVQVLGIVDSGSQSSALLAKGGVKRWLRVGDRLDEAVVSHISAGTVWLNVDGVHIKLTIGG